MLGTVTLVLTAIATYLFIRQRQESGKTKQLIQKALDSITTGIKAVELVAKRLEEVTDWDSHHDLDLIIEAVMRVHFDSKANKLALHFSPTAIVLARNEAEKQFERLEFSEEKAAELMKTSVWFLVETETEIVGTDTIAQSPDFSEIRRSAYHLNETLEKLSDYEPVYDSLRSGILDDLRAEIDKLSTVYLTRLREKKFEFDLIQLDKYDKVYRKLSDELFNPEELTQKAKKVREILTVLQAIKKELFLKLI